MKTRRPDPRYPFKQQWHDEPDDRWPWQLAVVAIAVVAAYFIAWGVFQ